MLKNIIVILLACVFLVWARLICKRMQLLLKVGRLCRKKGFRLQYRRGRFTSVFRDKGEIDFTVQTHDEKFAVSILTTRHYFARYHFTRDGYFTVYKRDHVPTVSVRNGRRAHVLTFTSGTRTRQVASYRTDFETLCKREAGATVVLLINPVPQEISRIEENRLIDCYDGDKLPSGITVYAQSGFLAMLQNLPDAHLGVELQ